jgi:RimJ/RimL family protein N-acetyltransferase
MSSDLLSVREIKKEDISLLVEYWFTAKAQFLLGMGVDITKMPKRDEFSTMLTDQLRQSYNEKQSYCTIWCINGKAIGHSNVNKIVFGREASMHLHVWNTAVRQKGNGVNFVKMSLSYFFDNLKLQKVYSEPYALNPAPNKTLQKAGFTFVKKYTTTPGFINFEQEVNRWEISCEEYKKLN